MLTLRSLSTSSLRLGLGLAVAALVISAVAAPLTASAQVNVLDNTNIVPMAKNENGPTPLPPNPGTPLDARPRADVQVIANGKTQNGNTTTYHFKIKNNGPANVPHVTGYKEAKTHANVGDGQNITDFGYFNFSLNSGQVKNFTITCVPQNNYYCDKGTMLVFLNGVQETNFANDIATID